jgi:hypothetical protein
MTWYPLLADICIQPVLPEVIPVIRVRDLIGETVDQFFETTCLG